nr:hypothetical protein [Pandoravirus massiliensis]
MLAPASFSLLVFSRQTNSGQSGARDIDRSGESKFLCHFCSTRGLFLEILFAFWRFGQCVLTKRKGALYALTTKKAKQDEIRQYKRIKFLLLEIHALSDERGIM